MKENDGLAVFGRPVENVVHSGKQVRIKTVGIDGLRQLLQVGGCVCLERYLRNQAGVGSKTLLIGYPMNITVDF